MKINIQRKINDVTLIDFRYFVVFLKLIYRQLTFSVNIYLVFSVRVKMFEIF